MEMKKDTVVLYVDEIEPCLPFWEDLDAVESALAGVEPVVPRRRTFYGSDELIVREPGGNVVTFAEFVEG